MRPAGGAIVLKVGKVRNRECGKCGKVFGLRAQKRGWGINTRASGRQSAENVCRFGLRGSLTGRRQELGDIRVTEVTQIFSVACRKRGLGVKTPSSRRNRGQESDREKGKEVLSLSFSPRGHFHPTPSLTRPAPGRFLCAAARRFARRSRRTVPHGWQPRANEGAKGQTVF
jgi:hypothetical protein